MVVPSIGRCGVGVGVRDRGVRSHPVAMLTATSQVGRRDAPARRELNQRHVACRVFGDANPTGAFSGMQALLLAILGVTIATTVGAYLLGVPIDLLWLVFGVVFLGLLTLALPRFKQAQPRSDPEKRRR